MKATYAANTKVPVSVSHAEILKLLVRHGAVDYGVAAQHDVAAIVFKIKSNTVRLRFPLPSYSDKDKPWTVSVLDQDILRSRPFNAEKDTHSFDKKLAVKLEQGTRERWRLIVLVIKTKLELVAMGARTIEQEFFDGLVLPNGRTVAQDIAEAWCMSPATLALPESTET